MSEETYKNEEINTGEGAPADFGQEKIEDQDGRIKSKKKKGGSF